MSVVDIFNIPSTAHELSRWGTLHMIWHRDMNRVVFETFNVVLPEYILDPFDFSTRSEIIQAHQTMHNNLDALLNVSSYNLTDVDMSDENQRAGWFTLHAQLTRQESNALGVFA